MRIDQDLHIHTHLSACCKEKDRQTPGAILALAEEMGVETVGFADHVWTNPSLAPSDWYRPQDETQIAKLRAELATVSTRIRYRIGCEAETIAPGQFGITPEFAGTLDFVLLACSHFHMKGFVAQPDGDTPRHLAVHMLAFFRSAVSSGLATSIAHPLLPLGHLERYDAAVETMSDGELLDALGLARDRGVGIEVTTGFVPSGPQRTFAIDTPVRILALAKQAGCKFTLASDAHSPEQQRRLPELSRLVDRIGLTVDDLLRV